MHALSADTCNEQLIVSMMIVPKSFTFFCRQLGLYLPDSFFVFAKTNLNIRRFVN